MKRTWMCLLLLAACDSWAPEGEMSSAVPGEMDETIEVLSAEHADELGLDLADYEESAQLAQDARAGGRRAAVESCGGLTYTRVYAASGCTGVNCRASNVPTECNSAGSPCSYFLGHVPCFQGQFADRSVPIHSFGAAPDLYFPTGTAGNPTSTQAYWAMHAGNTPSPGGNPPSILYRASAPQAAAVAPSIPSAWGSDDLEAGACPSGAISPGLSYLKMKAAKITQSGGKWWAVLPAAVGPVNGGAAPGIAQVFTGSCSGGKRPYRDMKTTDYFDPSHGWYNDQPAWVLDLGPTSGAPGSAFVRQRPATVPPDPGDDDGDDAPTCTPYPQPCTASSQCCPGTTCMNTILSVDQCCACLDDNPAGGCQSPIACENLKARGEPVFNADGSPY